MMFILYLGNLSISETPLNECFLQPCVTTTPKAPVAVSAVRGSCCSTPVPTSAPSICSSTMSSVSASTGDVAASCLQDDSNETNALTADSDPPRPSSVSASVSCSGSASLSDAVDHLPVGVHGSVGKRRSSTEASAAVNGCESSRGIASYSISINKKYRLRWSKQYWKATRPISLLNEILVLIFAIFRDTSCSM